MKGITYSCGLTKPEKFSCIGTTEAVESEEEKRYEKLKPRINFHFWIHRVLGK